eukprot:934792-Rhodomonas_salina.1
MARQTVTEMPPPAQHTDLTRGVRVITIAAAILSIFEGGSLRMRSLRHMITNSLIMNNKQNGVPCSPFLGLSTAILLPTSPPLPSLPPSNDLQPGAHVLSLDLNPRPTATR